MMPRHAWLLALAVCACDSPSTPSSSGPSSTSAEPHCKSITGALPGVVKFEECSDSRTRALSCNRSMPDEPQEEIFCACMIGDKMGASFTLFSDVVDAATDPERAIDIGHRRCGWELGTK